MKPKDDMKPKGDLHLVEYRNPAAGRCHRIWLFRKQVPAPDTSVVRSELMTTNDGNAVVVKFKDAAGNSHCHRYPMVNVARSEAGPASLEE